MATIALYNAFFHTARALLFRDGIKERSHFCVARYIEEKYVVKGLLNGHSVPLVYYKKYFSTYRLINKPL